MKAVVFQGPGSVAVEDRPEPQILAPDDAIVRVTMSTVCGTDVRMYWGRLPVPPGTAVGHEFTGVVEAVGSEVTSFQTGERVVSPFSVFCGGCFFCKQGLLTACEKRQVFGFGQLGGAQAEYVRVPRADALLEGLPDAVSDVQSAFLSDVLPGVFAGLHLAELQPGESVAAVGCGPTGLCAQMLALSMGAARVIGIDHHAERLAAAKSLGAMTLSSEETDVGGRVRELTDGRGVDIAVEATGTTKGLADAAGLARAWGRVLNLGLGVDRMVSDFPLGAMLNRHVRLVPASVPPVKNYIAPLVKMLAQGVIDPTPIATHVLPLSEAPRAYELMAKREDGALKVLLRP